MGCDDWDFLDNSTAFYLVKHQDLKWVSTNTTAMLNVPGTLSVSNPTFKFLFGRVMYEGRYYLGKLAAGQSDFNMYIETTSGYKEFSTGFEVLTCSS